MKLAVIMLLCAYMYLVLRLAGLLHHTGAYFAAVMAVLTTLNLIREWRDYSNES